MKASDLVRLHNDVGQGLAMMRGDFDKEIAAFKAASAEWDKRHNLDEETKRVAEEVRRLEADKSVAIAQTKEVEKKLQAKADALLATEEKLNERAKKLTADEAALLNAKALLEQQQNEFKANVNSMNDALAAKLKLADETLADLAARGAAIAQRESNVKAALKQVGTLVQ